MKGISLRNPLFRLPRGISNNPSYLSANAMAVAVGTVLPHHFVCFNPFGVIS